MKVDTLIIIPKN